MSPGCNFVLYIDLKHRSISVLMSGPLNRSQAWYLTWYRSNSAQDATSWAWREKINRICHLSDARWCVFCLLVNTPHQQAMVTHIKTCVKASASIPDNQPAGWWLTFFIFTLSVQAPCRRGGGSFPMHGADGMARSSQLSALWRAPAITSSVQLESQKSRRFVVVMLCITTEDSVVLQCVCESFITHTRLPALDRDVVGLQSTCLSVCSIVQGIHVSAIWLSHWRSFQGHNQAFLGSSSSGASCKLASLSINRRWCV